MPNLVCLLGVVDDCSGSNAPLYLLLLLFFFQILTVGADVGQVNAGKKVMPLIVYFSFQDFLVCSFLPYLKLYMFLLMQVLFSDISAYEVSSLPLWCYHFLCYINTIG